jgi:hypothetical protein
MLKVNNHHLIIAGKTILIQLAFFFGIIFVIWGAQKLYALTDKTIFPTPYAVVTTPEMSEADKGVQLIDALTNRMHYELDSTYGWSANDVIFNKWVMDNRAYRQYGTYVATKMLLDHYSTVIAKLGNSDRENEDLYEARLNHFALSPSRWGTLFIPSAEGSYTKAFESIEKYKDDLQKGKAVYNARTDDIYSAFNVVLGETIFGYALGLLQDTQNQPFYALDNKIYEVQGVMLVVRDYVNALYALYPEIAAKGNAENFAAAMDYLDRICEYDPMYITSVFNSGELIISYVLFARNRLEDIRDSIRI